MYIKASRASEASLVNLNKNSKQNSYMLPVSLRSIIGLGLAGALTSTLIPVVEATGLQSRAAWTYF